MSRRYDIHRSLAEFPFRVAEGRVPVRFTVESSRRVAEVRELICNALSFYTEHFRYDQDLAIVLLSKDLWGRITPLPYGMAHVIHDPTFIILPSTPDHQLADLVQRSLREHCGITREKGLAETSRGILDRIALHELGHSVNRARKISLESRWMKEYLATSCAYAYLKEQDPFGADLWNRVHEGFLKMIRPIHRSLEDFQTLYNRVGHENYAWYQAVFQKRIDEVFAQMGLRFITQLLDDWEDTTVPFVAGDQTSRLENRCAGFSAWIAEFGL